MDFMFIKKHSKVVSLFLALMMILTMGASNAVNAATTDTTLLNTYGQLFGKIGASVVYDELYNANAFNALKKEYNSTTIGNEMKPDYILSNWSPTLISVAQAKALGYYIPSNYTESTVPKLNFNQVDNVLKTCYENGIALRAHTLVWHAQTPDWYFRSDYSKNGGYVSQAVMDARLEFYVKSYMNHVYSSKYGSVVYAWDVVNEYLHADSKSGWIQIYGPVNTKASFVKKAFQFANQVLAERGLTNSVSLFYNDYNTYMVSDKIVELVKFINSDKKICNGVGMQSHVGTNFPSVSYYMDAVKKFTNAGFEIQITELDIANTSDQVQADYCYNLFSELIKAKKSGSNITGITFWGLADSNSWISKDNPLLYKTVGGTPKASYYSVLKAYTDSGSQVNPTPSPTPTPNSNYATLKDGWYYIKNVNAQKYLQVKDNVGANGQNVEIGTGSGVAGQKWQLVNKGEGYVTLKNGNGYMLDVAYGKDENGTNIQTYEANNTSAQLFKVLPTSQSGVYGIVLKCTTDIRGLDVSNKATTDGANVQAYAYYGATNQTWLFESCSAPGGSTPETPTEPEVPQAGDMIKVQIVSDWTSGATANITVTNLTGKALNGWTCTFTLNRPIASLWSATLVSQVGSTYTIANPDWQPNLAAGESYTFGCNLGSGPATVTATNASLK